jgi:hypothetical protein
MSPTTSLTLFVKQLVINILLRRSNSFVARSFCLPFLPLAFVTAFDTASDELYEDYLEIFFLLFGLFFPFF